MLNRNIRQDGVAEDDPKSLYIHLQNLIDFANTLSQQNETAEICRLVSQKAIDLLNAEIALLLLVNPRTRQTVKTIYKAGVQISQPRYRALQTQVSGWVLYNCQPVLCADIKQDARFSKVAVHDVAVTSIMGVPLKVEGIVIGTLLLFNRKDGEAFSEDDLEYFATLAMIAAPYLRNVRQIQQYFSEPLPESILRAKYEKIGLLGKSKKFLAMLQAIEAAAHTDVRVLLEGCSGTGKELVARAIHLFGKRNHGPFVAIDCGAIPANLLESELFGHVRGAFTGATQDRKGMIEMAHHGTLFMDEIGNLPLEMQAKLMRVLQDAEVRPLGSNTPRPVDVRIISACSSLLRTLVEKQQFREDLYYRLYVYPIYIPSLGERREDVPLLANAFLQRFAKQQNKKAAGFHEEILLFLQQQPWPGNVRELENLVERLVTLTEDNVETIGREALPDDLKKEFKKLKPSEDEHWVQKSLEGYLAEYEAELLRKALTAHQWNQSKAARALKISEQTLRYKMNKLGITKPS